MKKMSMSKSALMTMLITGTMVFGAASAFAEEVEPSFTLEEFVVTASRVSTSKVDTPANIAVITKEEIADHNYSDAAEALAKIPSVNILGSGAKGTSMGQDQILINGDNRVLVLIDGRRVNLGASGNYSADWLPPVNAIERIEVLKGGGSALYGTDAVGGVINVITKKGSDMDSVVTMRFADGSWGTEQYGITASGTTKSGLGVLVSASKERRGDYKYKSVDGKVKTLENSNYTNESINVKLDQKIGADNRLTFAFDYINAEGGAPFGYAGFGVTDRHERQNNNASLRYDWNEDSDQQGYFQVYKNHQHAQFLSPDEANQSDFTDSTFGMEAQQNFVTSATNQITAGVEYYKTKVENIAMYAGEKSINNTALFVEDRWQFAEGWQLNSGLRYDKHSEYGSEVTPKLALNKKFSKDSNAYLSWGKVFNAPTTDDLYWYQPAWGMFGNPDLNPEKGDVWTFGANTKLSDKTSLSGSVFYSDIKDAITWADPENDYSYTCMNVNQEKRRGLEVSVNHEFSDNLSGYLSYTYLQIKQDTGSGFTKDNSAKPNIYRAGLNYKNDDWNYNLAMTAVSGQSLAKYTDNSYFTLDLGAQYKLNKNAKVFVNGLNLTNARYQEYGNVYASGEARYPMPSRSFIAGVEYKF